MGAEKNPNGQYDLKELGVSLLWIFWRMYQCWDIVYYDAIVNNVYLTDKAKREHVEKQRKVEREEDEVYLRNMLLADHENIRRVHESERNLVVNMLVKCYEDHPRVSFCRAEDKDGVDKT